MKGRYMERRHHGQFGTSVLGWSLIVGGVAAGLMSAGMTFGGLVGVIGIVVSLVVIALVVVLVLGALGLAGVAMAAPFVALVGVPVMLLRALFRSGGSPSIDAQHRRERASPPAPVAQSPASQDAATEILRQRYAAGQLSQGEFQGMLINLLKERYIAAKIDQSQYEKQLEVLLQPPPNSDKVLRA
jgi:uncharacterized membrane protein